jgi:hypothetical protein
MDTEIQRMVESAERAGIELDPDEAAEWLQAVRASDTDEIGLDHRTGVFGNRIALLDFSPEDLSHFRSVGAIVEIPDEDGVETALALSGSAAQSKIQKFPGDADFFERVNIEAASLEAACERAGDVIRRKALATVEGPTHRLMEVKFGEYPTAVVRHGETMPAGAPISWAPDEIRAGEIECEDRVITWEEAAFHPGWTKLDWVVADRVRGQVVNASNMLDITWEAPDGSITPLDGFLDPYFQEVYLDASEIPLFAKLAQQVSADALDTYVEQLEAEVDKYLRGEHPNVGKAAKRMYNVFRLDGRYLEAAFIRELFDEPANALYQTYAVVRTVEEACQPGSTIEVAAVQAQLDDAIRGVTRALEGVEEEEIVDALLELRAAVEDSGVDSSAAARTQGRLVNLVNNFFHEKLTAMPEIREYMERGEAADGGD